MSQPIWTPLQSKFFSFSVYGMRIVLCSLHPSHYNVWAISVHLREIFRSFYLFLTDDSGDTSCCVSSLHLPLATEKFPCTSVNIASNIMWSLVNVLWWVWHYFMYREITYPLRRSRLLTGCSNKYTTPYTCILGINNTRVYRISITRVYRVSVTVYTCVQCISNTIHVYIGHQ